jgi:hypothetical protein
MYDDEELTPKTDRRGQHMVLAWQEAKKAGGIGYSPQQIDFFLNEREDVMLSRNEVKDRISDYFQSCMTIATDEETGETNFVWKRNPTKSALAVCLGITADTLISYVKGADKHGNMYKQQGFNDKVQKIATADFDLLRRAYSLIESFYEEKLGDNRNNAGTIFWLNNRENTKWSNQQEFTFNTPDTSNVSHLRASDLPRLKAPDLDTDQQDNGSNFSLPILNTESED